MTDAYVCRLLPLTCLVSGIVEAILDGRQPKGLRLAEILGNAPLELGGAPACLWALPSRCDVRVIGRLARRCLEGVFAR